MKYAASSSRKRGSDSRFRGNDKKVRLPGPGTPVTVVGLARSGAAAARLLLEQGCLVRVTEKNACPETTAMAQELMGQGAAVELGEHTQNFIQGSRLVVVSPGVPQEALPIRWAEALGIPVMGELELGSWFCPGRLVAVTGSNGKSTVVTLLGEILKAAGKEVVVCGNIGTPLCGVLHQIRPSTTVVLEVSSFQLEVSLSFHPEVACLLNVTTNHLDRHPSFEQYRSTKGRLFDYQSSRAWGVLNRDNPAAFSMKDRVRSQSAFFSRHQEVTGAYLRDGELYVNLPGYTGAICRTKDLSLQGLHHEENALAASCMSALLEVPAPVIGQVLRSFRGLPHRQEPVATIRGVTFVNDSKATTVAAGLRALEAAPRQVILIAGGRDKGSDFKEIRAYSKKLKAAVVIGEDAPKIAAALKGATPVVSAGSLGEAVQIAFEKAQAGEWVLLSPMCTSFDMFRDFEQRGERFIEAVRDLEAVEG